MYKIWENFILARFLCWTCNNQQTNVDQHSDVIIRSCHNWHHIPNRITYGVSNIRIIISFEDNHFKFSGNALNMYMEHKPDFDYSDQMVPFIISWPIYMQNGSTWFIILTSLFSAMITLILIYCLHFTHIVSAYDLNAFQNQVWYFIHQLFKNIGFAFGY